MSIERIEKLHSTAELLLAIANNYCQKHHSKPQFCGATREARKLAGDALKVGGVILCLAALFKTLK